MKKTHYHLLITLAMLTLTCTLSAQNPASGQVTENLELLKTTWRGEWRMDPGADWSGYTDIQLEPASVEFRKHWARDQRNHGGNRPTEENMQRIKTGLSEQLNEVFTLELTKNGRYGLSDKSGVNVMRITPGIVNLNLYAPDRMRDHIGYSMTDSKGAMTLELEIYDSVSGTLIASVRDHREDRQKGWFEWTTSGTNRRAAGFILTRWARDLREWLSDAGIPAKDLKASDPSS